MNVMKALHSLGALGRDAVRAIRQHKYEVSESGIYLPAARATIGGIFRHAHAPAGGEFGPWQVDPNRLVNEGLNLLSIAAVPLLAAIIPWQVWPVQWPFALQVLLAIVCADLGITLVHYASHRIGWLWRLHAVHHSVTRMYGFNGLMKHPLHQAAEAVGGVLPLLVLGLPMPVAAVLAFAIAIQLLLQHSNVDIRPGVLGRVMAWAPLHRFHHMRYGTAGDVNFGLFLTLWDHLLGTVFDAPGHRLRQRDLGIGSQPDYPRDYPGQLLAPFRELPHGEVPEVPQGLRRRE